jgi:hypothetical protein
VRPYDEDWRPRPDSLGRKRVRHVPSRFWDFPRTEAEYPLLLDALLDAVDPWRECVAVFNIFIEPAGMSHPSCDLDRIGDTTIPFSADGAVCFEATERGLLLELLVAHQRSYTDILVLPDHRRQRLSISHHGVVDVEFEDAADIPGFVSMMQENGFPLPAKAPDWTFKPQPWLSKEGATVAVRPFAFGEGEAIVPWSESPRTGASRVCRLERRGQFQAWLDYWMWIARAFMYPDASGPLAPFFDRLLESLDPWKEVLVVWEPRSTDECLSFFREERSELVEWLARCSGVHPFDLIPEHGREFLRFFPKHRRVDGVFSEPGRLDRCIAGVAVVPGISSR